MFFTVTFLYEPICAHAPIPPDYNIYIYIIGWWFETFFIRHMGPPIFFYGANVSKCLNRQVNQLNSSTPDPVRRGLLTLRGKAPLPGTSTPLRQAAAEL